MTFDDYQDFTHTTAVFRETCTTLAERMAYLTLGLCGEAGEIAEKVKKRFRKYGASGFHPSTPGYEGFQRELVKEAGDVLYYLAQFSAELGQGFGNVARRNKEKLESRQQRGVLRGDGDNR